MSDNGNKWDRNQILTLIGVIIAAATLVASVLIPEMRNCFGLKDGNPPAPMSPAPTPQPEPETISLKIETPPAKSAASSPKPPAVHEEKKPSGPQEYTIGENKSEFAKEANTRLSVAFHNIGSEETASVTIAPSGKNAIILPTVGGGNSKEFTSSTGVFLVSVLNVNWNSRTITVQVSRKI